MFRCIIRASVRGHASVEKRRFSQSQIFKKEKFLQISEEIVHAVASGKPVVALETTIYTHGRYFVLEQLTGPDLMHRFPVP